MRDMHISVESDSFHPESDWMGKLSDLQYFEPCHSRHSPWLPQNGLLQASRSLSPPMD